MSMIERLMKVAAEKGMRIPDAVQRKMELLDKATDKLPADQVENFQACMLGTLASFVDDKAWDYAISAAWLAQELLEGNKKQ